MSPALRTLGLVLACAHVLAASTPCGPGDRAASRPAASEATRVAHGRGADGHAHHGGAPHASHSDAAHADGSTAHAHDPVARAHGPEPAHEPVAHGGAALALRAPCSCGCDRAPGDGTPGHRLDPGLPRAATSLAELGARPLALAPAPVAPDAPSDAPDPVPLRA